MLLLKKITLTFFIIIFHQLNGAAYNTTFAQEEINAVRTWCKDYQDKNPTCRSYDSALYQYRMQQINIGASSRSATFSSKENEEQKIAAMLAWCDDFKRKNETCELDDALVQYAMSPPIEVQEPDYITRYKTYLKEKNIDHCCNINVRPCFSTSFKNQILNDAPERLIRAIHIFNNKQRSTYKKKKKLNKFLLLHGYPGTGKSTLGSFFGMMTHRPFLKVNAAAIATKWKESEVENVLSILDLIITTQDPWVILLDELDGISKSSSTTSEQEDKVFSALSSKLDENINENLTLLATTNNIESIASKVKSRFRRGTCKINLPNTESRENIVKIYLEEYEIEYSADLPSYIAKEIEGFAARDIAGLIADLSDIIELELQSQLKKKGLSQAQIDQEINNRKLKATHSAVLKSIEEYKDCFRSGKDAITSSEKAEEDSKKSKDYWNIKNFALSQNNFRVAVGGLLVATAVGATGYYFQIINLGITKEQLGIAYKNLENATQQLMISRSQLITNPRALLAYGLQWLYNKL
jgi:Holliday junction resolvasome RuvABC ATP-dependent DNA helicase subunit